MHCDMLKIQDGVAIVEKLNWFESVMLSTRKKTFFFKIFHKSDSLYNIK